MKAPGATLRLLGHGRGLTGVGRSPLSRDDKISNGYHHTSQPLIRYHDIDFYHFTHDSLLLTTKSVILVNHPTFRSLNRIDYHDMTTVIVCQSMLQSVNYPLSHRQHFEGAAYCRRSRWFGRRVQGYFQSRNSVPCLIPDGRLVR
jgi:hypothetical protein